jgi:hypothetical protein
MKFAVANKKELMQGMEISSVRILQHRKNSFGVATPNGWLL